MTYEHCQVGVGDRICVERTAARRERVGSTGQGGAEWRTAASMGGAGLGCLAAFVSAVTVLVAGIVVVVDGLMCISVIVIVIVLRMVLLLLLWL